MVRAQNRPSGGVFHKGRLYGKHKGPPGRFKLLESEMNTIVALDDI